MNRPSMAGARLSAVVFSLTALSVLRAAAVDPLPSLLADDWDAPRQREVLERVRALGAAACPTLAGYASARDPRAREHAVRVMADAGCGSLQDYRGFFADTSAWVVAALIDATTRYRIAAAVPFLLSHLGDERRLVSDDGSRAIDEEAERGLRRLAAQPIPRLPHASGHGTESDAAAWRAWYAAHAGEPPSAWLDAGLAAIRRDLDGSDERRRATALDTLALLGEPGRTLLTEAMRRAPGDLEASLLCQPDEPPRVVDQVPCTLTIRNLSTHRVPLALGESTVSLGLQRPAQAGEPAGAGRKKETARGVHSAPEGAAHGGAAGDRTATSATGHAPPDRVSAPAALPLLAGHILDLGVGEVVRREVRAGPVPAAGRYDVRAGVIDLARPLFADLPGGPPDGLEAVVTLRFEQ